jgi:hypothetical protein
MERVEEGRKVTKMREKESKLERNKRKREELGLEWCLTEDDAAYREKNNELQSLFIQVERHIH